MERQEQYDPEDIEALLLERPFEDLLPEERAFVLRHLSGQDEYEAMRATLNAVRHLDSERMPITAGAAVRDNVMTAFRAQQQPQWRIWLNSVGALFIPNPGHGMWAPALRIAGVAAVIGVGIWSIARFDDLTPDKMVAEVKDVKNELEPSSPDPSVPSEEATTSTSRDSDAAKGAQHQQPVGATNEREANGSADANIESPAVDDETKALDIAEVEIVPAPAMVSSGVTSVANEAANEDVAGTFDPRTATDTIMLFDKFVSAAPAKGSETLDAVVIADGTAARAEQQKVEVNRRSKGVLALEKDKDGAMANSRALDQRLLSLQNAAW
ncbi:MAG: hypothetical protein ABI599_00570 [Flavobacteriales bacterium]